MGNKKQVGIALIVISIVLACISGGLLISIIGSEEQSKKDIESQYGNRAWVIVAQNDIPARTALTINALVDGRLKLDLRPRSFIPASAFVVDAEDATQAVAVAVTRFRDRIKGFTLIPLKSGDILSPSVLETTVVVPDNMRAVAVAVDSVTSVSGYVHPGDMVDVIVSYEQTMADQKKNSRTVVLFQNKSVLSASWFTNVGTSSAISSTVGLTTTVLARTSSSSIGGSMTPSDQNRQTIVTLALTLEEATRLAYMQDFGKEIHLVIRRSDDTAIQPTQPVLQDTFGK
jgi:Flp pilus assembly protein CpaB